MKKIILGLVVLTSISALADTVYFSARLDAKSANIKVEVAAQECTLQSSDLKDVQRSVGFVGDEGLAEKIATCEFNIEKGDHDYKVTITPATGKRKAFLYYWALDNKPINNRLAMTSWFWLQEVNSILNLKISQSDKKIKLNKPLVAEGIIKIQ